MLFFFALRDKPPAMFANGSPVFMNGIDLARSWDNV
jgi:hypothetical protein